MDEQSYKTWWQLHLRAAKGEVLTAEEKVAYETGRQQLYAEEKLDSNIDELRQIRAEIQALETEREQLLIQRRQLQEKVARLEASLSDAAKLALGVGG